MNKKISPQNAQTKFISNKSPIQKFRKSLVKKLQLLSYTLAIKTYTYTYGNNIHQLLANFDTYSTKPGLTTVVVLAYHIKLIIL